MDIVAYPYFWCSSSLRTTMLKSILSTLCFQVDHLMFEEHPSWSEPRPSLDDHWYPPVRLDTESSHDAPPLLLEGDSKQIEMLKEMEGDLIELNSKLNKYVAGHSLEKYAPGQYRNEVPTRPEVMAAMFFAAGMAFERQVDSACRLRMYRATDDPLLPGETPLLSGGNTPFLLEDVSPTFRRDSSANPEVKEADTFCPARKKSFRLCENSSNSCGEQKPCSCTSEVASSLAGEIDEDDNDQSYFNSPIDAKDMPMRLPDPELVSPRTSNNTCSPHGETSPSKETMNVITNETLIQKNSSKRKNKVLNVLDSVIEAFAVVGLSGSGTKETQYRGCNDEVTVPRSMLGRQEVTSIQKIRMSNPGLGWLSSSMQIDRC
ncbi:uncharacterized protein [Physcomitrium patens]|uniref:uncharacterized protein isoform X3 n=1 Tax=Physcomitrium patens TaxID=3218 RepID=UPI003CCD14C2